MSNVFLAELNPKYRDDLVKLKANESLATKIVRDISAAYHLSETKYKRHSDHKSCITLNPHTYGRFSAGSLTVTPNGVVLSIHVREKSDVWHRILKPSAKVKNQRKKQSFDYGLVDSMLSVERDSVKDYDLARERVYATIKKQALTHGITVEIHRDNSCGDSFELVMDLTGTDKFNKFIQLWMLILAEKNVKIRLESL